MQTMLYTIAIEEPQKAYNLEYDVIKLAFEKNHPGTIKEEILEGVKRARETSLESDEKY